MRRIFSGTTRELHCLQLQFRFDRNILLTRRADQKMLFNRDHLVGRPLLKKKRFELIYGYMVSRKSPECVGLKRGTTTMTLVYPADRLKHQSAWGGRPRQPREIQESGHRTLHS
jgi:hypothetical protein